MYIHWLLYSLMFTGFEILFPPLYTCPMAFPVQAHFQTAPTFPLNRTLSLMPLGPGLLSLLSTNLAPCKEQAFNSIFPLASHVKTVCFLQVKQIVKKKNHFGKCQGRHFLPIWNKSLMLCGRDTHELMTHVSSAEGSSTALWFVTDSCLDEHRHHKAFCMIGARLFILQISDGDLSEMLLLWILTSSHHAEEEGKKKER